MLLPFCILIRIKSFLNPPEEIHIACANDFSEGLLSYAGTGIRQAVITTLLVFIQAVMVNRLVIKNKLSHELTLIPGMLYIIFVSFIPSFLSLSEVLFANTFFLLSLHEIFRIYKNPRPSSYLFNAGLYGALASLIYFPFILIIPMCITTIATLRTMNLKELLQYLGGLICPFVLMFTIYYYQDNASEFFFQQWLNTFSIPFTSIVWGTVEIISMIIFLLSLVYFVVQSNQFLKKKNLASRKKISVCFLWMIMSIFGLFLTCDLSVFHLIILSVIFVIFSSFILLKVRNFLFVEILNLLLLFLLFNNHFNLISFTL